MGAGEITDTNAMLDLMPSLLHSIAHATLTDNVIDFNNLLPGEYGSLSKFGICASEEGDHQGRDAWCRRLNSNFVIPGQPVAPPVAAPTPVQLMLFLDTMCRKAWAKHMVCGISTTMSVLLMPGRGQHYTHLVHRGNGLYSSVNGLCLDQTIVMEFIPVNPLIQRTTFNFLRAYKLPTNNDQIARFLLRVGTTPLVVETRTAAVSRRNDIVLYNHV